MHRSSVKRSGIAAAVLVLMLASSGAWARQHQHDPGVDSAKPAFNHGKKWRTDQPLRVGMAKIAALIAPLEAAPPDARIDPGVAHTIADGIKQQVAYLVGNCKLAPKADAVLHTLIADILLGANALSGAAPSNRDAAPIRAALARYPVLFSHPNWPPANPKK